MPLPTNMFPNKLPPKVPNNVPKSQPFCSTFFARYDQPQSIDNDL